MRPQDPLQVAWWDEAHSIWNTDGIRCVCVYTCMCVYVCVCVCVHDRSYATVLGGMFVWGPLGALGASRRYAMGPPYHPMPPWRCYPPTRPSQHHLVPPHRHPHLPPLPPPPPPPTFPPPSSPPPLPTSLPTSLLAAASLLRSDVAFDGASKTFSFHTTHLAPLALVMRRTRLLPYAGWAVRPTGGRNGNGAAISLDVGLDAPVVIEVSGWGERVGETGGRR